MKKFPPRVLGKDCADVTLPGLDLAGANHFAGVLAHALAPGDVILLDGPLAAGKTAFVAMTCAALGCRERVSSPTYTISHVYDASEFAVHHIDTYRLEDKMAFQRLGLEEFLTDGVTFIEWGDRVASDFPEALRIEIVPEQDDTPTRSYHLSSADPDWQRFIADMAVGTEPTGRTS